MIERHGHDADLRAALLARPNLPAAIRSDLAGAAAKALEPSGPRTTEKADCLTGDVRDRANVQIAAESACEANGALHFVAHLRGSGQLTAGLLLRGLLCGNKHLHVAALCELTEVPMARMAGVVAASKSAGLAALFARPRCQSACCLLLSRAWRRSRNPVSANRWTRGCGCLLSTAFLRPALLSIAVNWIS